MHLIALALIYGLPRRRGMNTRLFPELVVMETKLDRAIISVLLGPLATNVTVYAPTAL